MKKRIFAGTIAAALVLCSTAVPAGRELPSLSVTAEAAAVSGISASATAVSHNDEFTVSVTVPPTSGIADSAQLWVDFDPSAFEVVTWAPTVAQMPNIDNKQGFFSMASANARIDMSSGIVMTATVKVKNTAPAGTYDFKIRDGKFSCVTSADGMQNTTLWTPSVKTVSVGIATNPVSGTISVKGVNGTAYVVLKNTVGTVTGSQNVTLYYNSSSGAYEGSYSFADAPSGCTIEITLGKCPVYIITVGSDSVENAVLRMYGDVDGNGVIEANDATQILRYKVGMTSWIKASDGTVDNYIKSAASINGGGEPTEQDATAILRYITGYTSVLTGI